MTTASPRPMRADARRNRERVLQAAREVLGRDGLDAQIDDIAAAAGVGVGTVYRNFETKDALIRALADDHFATLNEHALAAGKIEDPWEAFADYMVKASESMTVNRALAALAAEKPDVMADAAHRADVERGFFDNVGRLIKHAQDAGALRPDFELEDVPAIACSLGALQLSPKGGLTNWRRVMAFVLDGLRSPSGAELPPIETHLPRRKSR